MAYQESLAAFKTVIAVDRLRSISNRLENRHTPESSKKVQAIVAKYFMDDYPVISNNIGNPKHRELMQKDLQDAKDTLAKEFPPLRDKASSLGKISKEAEKGAISIAILGCIGAIGHLASKHFGFEPTQIGKNLEAIMPFFLTVATISVVVSLGFAFAGIYAADKGKSILKEAGEIKNFIESAIDFVSAEWKTQVMKSFR